MVAARLRDDILGASRELIIPRVASGARGYNARYIYMYNGTVSRLHYNYIDNAVLTCRAACARNTYVFRRAEPRLKHEQVPRNTSGAPRTGYIIY